MQDRSHHCGNRRVPGGNAHFRGWPWSPAGLCLAQLPDRRHVCAPDHHFYARALPQCRLQRPAPATAGGLPGSGLRPCHPLAYDRPFRQQPMRPLMFADRIEGKWIDAFGEVFARCAAKPGDTAAILSETQSRQLNVHLAELALLRLGVRPFHIVLPTPRNPHAVPVRSTGASVAIGGLAPVVSALSQAGFVVDCTLEGLMHAPETPAILKAGARILYISNEHPEALERMRPDDRLEADVRKAARMLRGAKRMTVTSAVGTMLDVDMAEASTVGIWGWTDRPGTLAHWPGGIVVSFPRSGAVNGTLVLDRGDVNLTFK